MVYTQSTPLLQRIVSHALTIIPQIKFPAITPTIHTLRENPIIPPHPLSPGEATHMNSLPTWFECSQKNPTTNKSSLEPTVRLDKQILQTAEAAGVP
jgi:hypothetical protein